MPKTFPKLSKGFHPFAELINLNFTKVMKGYSQCSLEINEKLLNPHKVLHGGVMYSMADTGMGGALYPLLDENESCATIEIKINYFRAVKSGILICDTKIIHKGRSTATIESKIKKDDELIAKAVGTYSIFKVKSKET